MTGIFLLNKIQTQDNINTFPRKENTHQLRNSEKLEKKYKNTFIGMSQFWVWITKI